MDIFNAALLAAAHGIAIINAGTLPVIHTGLQCLRVAEFAAPVGQDGFKKDMEGHCAKPSFQTVKNSPDSAFGTPVQKIRRKQFLIPEIEGQDAFFRIPGRLDCIHLNHMRRRELLEIAVEAAGKHLPVHDLGFMAFACFEPDFSFQIDVATGKQAEFYVLVDGAYRESGFRMLHNNLIRRVPLQDQRGDDLVNTVELLP